MIRLTKFSGEEFWVNPDVVKYLEEGGDTIVYLTTGERLLVKEEIEEIRSGFLEYKRHISQGLPA